MTMSTNYYQQGDVLLKSISSLPKGAKPLSGPKVLQEGETTGHMHQFDTGAAVRLYLVPPSTEAAFAAPAPGLRITEMQGTKYIEVLETSLLRHEEHQPISVPPGLYQMDIVREYDYDKEETRRVVD